MNGINDCKKTRLGRLSAIVILQSLIVIAVGCKSPFDRTKDASGGGALGTFGNGNLVVFSNELKTGGGAFLYPSGENQSLSFSDTSNPISARSIRYSWNGQNVANQHVFVGFDLMDTATQADYGLPSNTGRDLRAAGYTQVTFFARGSLSTNTFIKVEVAEPSTTPGPCVSLSPDGSLDDSPPATPCGHTDTLSSSWKQYAISFPNSDLASVKDFFKATFVYKDPGNIPGQGGTVYFDQIQYTP